MWCRQPFMTEVATGEPSYTPSMSEVAFNMIIANYGASQGFDTDDGSSWYDIHHNFLYQSDGKKMDYGGHDCAFHDNLVYVEGKDGQNCINTASFLPGHGLCGPAVMEAGRPGPATRTGPVGVQGGARVS